MCVHASPHEAARAFFVPFFTPTLLPHAHSTRARLVPLARSSRFRTLVAERLGVDARSVHGLIVGEHGDSSVPVWSALEVGGIRLRDVHPPLGSTDGSDPDNWAGVHGEVVAAAGEIIRLKGEREGRGVGRRVRGVPRLPTRTRAHPAPPAGYTSWAIGLTIASLAETVLRNEHRVHPLSVPVQGRYGITDDVCLSLPSVLGRDGVHAVLSLVLDADEAARLKRSADAIAAVQRGLDLTMPPA